VAAWDHPGPAVPAVQGPPGRWDRVVPADPVDRQVLAPLVRRVGQAPRERVGRAAPVGQGDRLVPVIDQDLALEAVPAPADLAPEVVQGQAIAGNPGRTLARVRGVSNGAPPRRALARGTLC